MAIRHYYDFIIFFDYIENAKKDQAGRIQKYSLRVLNSPVGEGEQEEVVPIEDWDKLETWRSALADRKISSVDFEKFAIRLGELLLPQYARQMFNESLIWLDEDEGEGLRIRLRLIPELAFLPWEYFLIKQHGGEIRLGADCLTLNYNISIVRHEAISIPAPPFKASDHLRVIVAMASPEPFEKYHPLRLAEEQKIIKAKLNEAKGVTTEYYPDFDQPGAPAGITKNEIESILKKHAVVFHFSGHGKYRKVKQNGKGVGQGLLVLAKEHNQADEIESEILASMLARGHIRFVVLGACESGERDRFLQWSSVALALLRAGIPAVVAMQFSIRDDLAIVFLSKLYENLACGLEIDEAVNQGRRAVYFKKRKDRDWGTPVLYLRNAGGRIFPPILDEQARILALQASEQDTTRDKIYLGYLQKETLANPDQLNDLKKGVNTLNLSILHAVLLLKSALVNDQDPDFWVKQLRKTGKEWLTAVDKSPQILDEGDIALAAQQLGLTGQLPTPPQNVGMLAWSAAVYPDGLVSQTAALAQLAAEPDTALTKILTALSLSHLSKRRQRRARLIGIMAEASPEISKELPKRLDHFLDRASVRWWRVRWRMKRNQSQMIKWGLGGAFGAGLALAIWRGFWAIFNTRFVGPEFAIQSYWGFIIGLFMTIGIVLASPILLMDPENLNEKQEKRRTRWTLLLGAVGFSLANGLVMWMTGLGITWIGFLSFLFTSFLAGLALGIGLIRQPWAGWPTGLKEWLKRLLLPALLLALLQLPVLFEGVMRANGEYILGDPLWNIASIFDSSNAVFGKYHVYLGSVFDQCVPGAIGQSCLSCPDAGPLEGCLEEWLSILDAAATGIVMIVGMLTGLHFSETRLGKTWEKLVSRLGFSD